MEKEKKRKKKKPKTLNDTVKIHDKDQNDSAAPEWQDEVTNIFWHNCLIVSHARCAEALSC